MQKRVTLTTVNPANGGVEAEDRNGLTTSGKKAVTPVDKNKKKESEVPVRTIRLQVDLLRPTKDHYSELHYDELIRKQVEASASKSGDGRNGPFPDEDEGEDEDVVRLARSFNEKYGSKKRRCGWDDYVDKGMGYDETDPFIDNDEAYDELIPSSLTTKYGGFYVNTGPLDFKPVPQSDLPSDSPAASRPLPATKRRKSVNGSAPSAGSQNTNNNNKKKKRDHPPEQKTVAQILQEQKRQNQVRDTHSPEDSFLHPMRKARPMIQDDDEIDVDKDAAGISDGPRSHSIDDVIECVARGRANGAQAQKPQHTVQQSSATPFEKQSVIRMAGDGRETKMEGLAMSSLARMVSITGRTEGDHRSANSGHQQQNRVPRPTDLSQHSSRPTQEPSSSSSQGFRQHPGLVDQQPKASSSTSLLSRTGSGSSLLQAPFYKNAPQTERSATPLRTQQSQPTGVTDHQSKQSPTSAQIRNTFQSVIKTSVDSKKVTESATMDSLMEKVISNSLQKFPNSSSTSFPMQSSSLQMQAKNFKTPPAAHQQPKNAFVQSFLDPPAIRAAGRTHLDAMIVEHLNADSKPAAIKLKSETPQAATDSLSHAKVIKYKDQYRIPNLPIGPKERHHSSSSSSNRPNSLPGTLSGKVQQSSQPQSPQQQLQQQGQSRPQKTSPPSVSASCSSQQKGSQSKSSHSSRSSPSHVRHSPHTTEALTHHSFSPVMQTPQSQLWNPMALYGGMGMFDAAQFLTSRSPPTSMTGGLRPLLPGSQNASNLPANPFLNMHSYAAPPSGGTKEETG